MPCGPEDFGIGDIVSVEFGIMVVNSRNKGDPGLRMIYVLRGVTLIQKFMPDQVRKIVIYDDPFYILTNSKNRIILRKMKVLPL